MTVGELIDELEGLPYDAEVVTKKIDDGEEYDYPDAVYIDDDGDCVLVENEW